MRDIDMDKTLDAIWCVDSETSDEVLLDRRTNKVIARRTQNGKIDEPKNN